MSPPKTKSTVTEENITRLKEKLRELFQLDRGDLDFGLYRIMALKSAEVGDFLDDDLLPQVSEALSDIAQSDTANFEAVLAKQIEDANRLGVNPEETPAVKETRAKIAAAKSDQQTEADTYNHLCNFFSRYYDQGDFMSLRRYKSAGREAYAIPYNGEEVKLHWANADQYYIKTTENYSSYVFVVVPGKQARRVRFEIAAADNEKDNIKATTGKQRFFVLAKDVIAEQADDLIIRFDHRPLTDSEKTRYPQNGSKRQGAINADTEKRILKKVKGDWPGLLCAPCPTETDESRTLLGKHLNAYTARNSFDYFIHKDLGGFLRRELDYYLKSEVISVDNLTLADDPAVFMRSLKQVKAIKHVGSKIIDFLAQLEDFQKQLWLKKKFVLETQYCVTLDKVPESLYAAIAKNKAQVDEWVRLFAIDEIKHKNLPLPMGEGRGEGTPYSKPLKSGFLKENPYLVLDTRYFDKAFTDKLLAALSEAGPIEEQMNGLLVHGENFQALNLLQERYREQVQCVYIDPPYNTGGDGFIYKDSLQHSSWMTMLENRYVALYPFLTSSSTIFTSIGEEENAHLDMLLKVVFGSPNKISVATREMKKGANRGTHFAPTIDYLSCWALDKESVPNFWVPFKEEFLSSFSLDDEDGKGKYKLTALYEPSLEYFKNCRYPVLCPDGTFVITPAGKSFSHNKESYEEMSANNRIIIKKGRSSLLQTIDGSPTKWRALRKIYLSEALAKGKRPQDLILDIINSDGTKMLTALGLELPFSKPVELASFILHLRHDETLSILDYFAGSGTTGHAVINLNREDGGNRKYILVEIGRHFVNVLLPRIKKAIYSKEWKDGKPVYREGISQLFRYICIESYEDTLDSLIINSRKDLVAAAESEELVEDYQLRYALGEETTESASLVGKDFIDPFNYTLSVVRDGVRRDVKVDLAETFNYLLGLKLTSRRQIDDVLTITGTNAKGEICLILWRNLEKMNASKLEKWFAKYRKAFDNGLNLIYVNGDHTLNALRKSREKWEAITTESVFRALMFENIK